MGGGKTTSETALPQWLQDAAQTALGRANTTSQIGYTPYMGPDVAAMTPMQEAAMSNVNAGASAFGMAAPTSSGMPEAQTFAGGVRGYSSAPMYEAAVNELKTRYPGQYNALMAPFIDPVTGAMPQGAYGTPQPQPQLQPQPQPQPQSSGGGGGGGGGDNGMMAMPRSSGSSGGGNGFASTPLAARLPGGVNDPNLTRTLNQIIAKATQTKPSAPTQADRPVSRSSGTTSSGTRSGGSFRGGR